MEKENKDDFFLTVVLKYIILAILATLLISIFNLIINLALLLQPVIEIDITIFLTILGFGGFLIALFSYVAIADVIDKYLKRSSNT